MTSCLQAKPNTTISASDVNTTDLLDFLALPFGPGCYVNHSVINTLVENAVTVPEDEHLQGIISSIPHRFAHTLKKPKNAETNFCRVNLCSILRLILFETQQEGRKHFQTLRAEDLQRYCNFFLVKASSKPELSVVFTNGIWQCGIIGAEAKTVDHGYHEAAAQGVSLSADFAMELASMGVPAAAVAVPFVLAFSDSVQFGAVYLIEENFPCAVMLSPPLSLLTDCTRVSIAKWIAALGKHCNEIATYLDSHPPSGRALQNKCRVSRDRVFFKPIAVPSIEDTSFAVTHLLSVFQLLYSYEPCREYIVFPLGQMGMPDDSQFEMKGLLLSLLERKFLNSDIVKIPGCPLIMYPRLGPEWRNCGEHKQHLVPIKEAFLIIVANIFTAVEAAGVVHLDARLFNFMFKLENGGLSVKLIDWDSCLRMGRHVAPTLLSRFRGDYRYPQENNAVATPSYHQYFFQRIVDELNV